jgi:hypothetical protein
VHIYAGNFLAAERHIWDPVTHARHPAGLTEPLAPPSGPIGRFGATSGAENGDDQPTLAGTAFAAIAVRDVGAISTWLASTFGLTMLTTDEESCAVDERFQYLVEPGSLTIVGVHARASMAEAGLDHLALRVASVAQLEHWRDVLRARGVATSPVTMWNFGTFVEVVGPENLTIRLFVPAVR